MADIDYNKVPVPTAMDFENYAVFMNWANGPLGKLSLTIRQRSSITFGKLWKERFLPVEKDAIRSTVGVRVYFGKPVGISRRSALHFITLYFTKFFGRNINEVPFMKVKNFINYMRFQHNEAVVVDYERNWEVMPEVDDDGPIDENPKVMNGNRN